MIAWLVLPLTWAATARAENALLRAALETITRDDLQRHVYVLADDTFEGREAGSRGGRAAGVYLSKQMTKSGLRQAGTAGSWFQPFGDNYRNVLGLMEGADAELKKQVILLSAHYDHVGYGTARNSYGPTGYIHNGADDNASGTAGLLEVAEAFAALGTPPKRSVLFALWDAEEKGLLGSEHWSANPTISSPVVINVNLDMIGRAQNGRTEVIGTRTSWGLRRLISRHNPGTDLWLDFTWELRRNSDHWPFYERNVPVVMFHTGRHGDYHRPSDDAEKINGIAQEQISRMLFQVVHELADSYATPRFRPASRHESPDLRRQREVPLPPRPGRLGVRWNEVGETASGLTLIHVVPGSAAAQAGLKIGDRLTDFNGGKITSDEQFRGAVLAASSPVRLSLLRAGEKEPLVLEVPLAGNPIRIGISIREDDAEPGSVMLSRVMSSSPAARAGLRVGDRIYQVAGQDFANADGFLEQIKSLPSPQEWLIERNGQWQTTRLELSQP